MRASTLKKIMESPLAIKVQQEKAENIRRNEALVKMLDYWTATNSHKYCNGFVSIGFRTNTNPSFDINHNNFILNSCGDGWFRKDKNCGITSSHGLMIRNIKITSRKPIIVGDFICYKASIIYETNNHESEIVEDKFWVFVQKEFDIKDVVEYIDTHINEWSA